MQTFRAYIQNPAGEITWAAWIEAAHRDDALVQMDALRQSETPTLELWSATERRPDASSELEPV